MYNVSVCTELKPYVQVIFVRKDHMLVILADIKDPGPLVSVLQNFGFFNFNDFFSFSLT